MSSSDVRIAQLAEQQSGCVTRRQALAVGMTDHMIRRRVASGLWIRMSRGSYRLAGSGPAARGPLISACLRLPGAVASHESAARMLGFPGIGGGPAVVTVPANTTHRIAGVQVHETSDLALGDTEEQGPITLTGPVRTMIDLASILRPDRLARLLDDLLVARVVSLDAVVERHVALARRGKKGTRALRVILDERRPGYIPPESELEARFLALIANGGLPEPVRQMALPWRAPGRERVDFAYPESRLIIECDGRRWHTRERDFARDRQRDNEAMLAGWRVLRVTYDQVTQTGPAVLAMVRRALAAEAA